jgi:hypothetical protein
MLGGSIRRRSTKYKEIRHRAADPAPGLVSTIALSRVGHGAYLPGSAIGLVPKAAPLVLLGAGTLHARSREPRPARRGGGSVRRGALDARA